MSRVLDQLKQHIANGKNGLNKGIPWGIRPVDRVVAGVQRGRYDVVFGEEGTGKTALVDQAYVLNPMRWLEKNPKTPFRYTVFYYTLEIEPVKKLIKWGCWLNQRNKGGIYGINNVLAIGREAVFDEVLSKRIGNYSYEIDKRITAGYKNMRIKMRTSPNVGNIVKEVTAFMNKRGKFLPDPVTNEKYYMPNDQFHLVQVIVDNAGNLESRKGGKKQIIDDFSQEIIKLRNTYGISFTLVMHANRALTANDRNKAGEIFPKNSDIKETHQPAQDANTVLALFNPYRHMNDKNNLGSMLGYPVAEMDNMLRVLGILKNRDGRSDLRLPLAFCGPTGAFRHVPPSNVFDEMPEIIDNFLAWTPYPRYGHLVKNEGKQTELNFNNNGDKNNSS